MITSSAEDAVARIVDYADTRAARREHSTGDALLDQLRADADRIEGLH